jgi:hypothetical protein
MNGALRVQLTKQEKQLIQAAAEKVGESLTEFIHKAALDRCTKEAAYQWGHHFETIDSAPYRTPRNGDIRRAMRRNLTK